MFTLIYKTKQDNPVFVRYSVTTLIGNNVNDLYKSIQILHRDGVVVEWFKIMELETGKIVDETTYPKAVA